MFSKGIFFFRFWSVTVSQTFSSDRGKGMKGKRNAWREIKVVDAYFIAFLIVIVQRETNFCPQMGRKLLTISLIDPNMGI